MLGRKYRFVTELGLFLFNFGICVAITTAPCNFISQNFFEEFKIFLKELKEKY